MLYYGTVTRKALDLRYPKSEDIDILDIAYPLANTCRYNGQSKIFYSVAQHSVRVAMALPQPFKLEGLLHDAAEAYTGDLARPLQDQFPELKAAFDKIAIPIEWIIRRKYGLPCDMSPLVKKADDMILQIERFEIGHTDVAPKVPAEFNFPTVKQNMALSSFLQMFYDLYKG